MTTSTSTGLSRELRTEMWLALANRLQAGEVVYSNEQFCQVLLGIYTDLTGQEPTAAVLANVTAMVETVNRDHPETYLKQGVQNGIARAFEAAVQKQNWDRAQIESRGARALRRFSQQDSVRDMLEDAHLQPSQLSVIDCMQRVMEQIAPSDDDTSKRPPPPPPPTFRPDLAPPAQPDVPAAAPAGGIDAEAEAAVAEGDVDAETARERAKEHEERRTVLEAEEMEKTTERLDGLVQQGIVTEDEAEKLREIRKVDERVKAGEITETEATEIRNSLLNKDTRDKLERKIRDSVSETVKYVQVFEGMKKIGPKYHDALGFMIQHKNLITAKDGADVDMSAPIKALMEDVELLDDLADVMERKDQELRMISVRLSPYSAIMSRGVERISNMTIEESFLDDLVNLDGEGIADRLSSGDAATRVRPAADMRCLISLVDHVTKKTRFRKELRLLRIARQLEEFYQNTSDMKEARHQAENFLNRRLRRMFPDMNADEAAELKQRSNEMMDQIEQRIHDERKAEVEAKRAKAEASAAAAASSSNDSDDDMELSEDEIQKGVQIGRVEMRIAGSTRRIPTKMMPDPDDPEVMVIVQRDPDTQELVPAKRRGAKRIIERGRDGYWSEVR